jgi:hypothetical protein
VAAASSSLEFFDADISGRDFAQGKPHPEIFLTGAAELGVPPEHCFVVEDATSGVQAAKAGGMAALGVARASDEALLAAANADLVVTSLDDVDVTVWVPNSSSIAVTSSVARRWLSGMIVDHGGATAVSELPAAGGVAWPAGRCSRSTNQQAPRQGRALTGSKIRQDLRRGAAS